MKIRTVLCSVGIERQTVEWLSMVVGFLDYLKHDTTLFIGGPESETHHNQRHCCGAQKPGTTMTLAFVGLCSSFLLMSFPHSAALIHKVALPKDYPRRTG